MNEYDDYPTESSRPSEIFITTERIKKLLFELREKLQPVIRTTGEVTDMPKQGSSTPLQRELHDLVDIVESLKKDIQL